MSETNRRKRSRSLGLGQTPMAGEVMSTQGHGNQPQGRKRTLRPRSEVWEHFTRHTDDDGKGTVKCKRCGKVYAYHGTKNLWKHYNEGCGGQECADAATSEQPPQPLPSLAQDDEAMQQLPPLPPVPLPLPFAPSHHGESSDRNSSSLQEEACRHLARMFALCGYDASVLENDSFKSFVRTLNPEFEVPSRIAIENMCDGIVDEAMRDLLDRLRRLPGKVNVAVGIDKTMEEQVFYVACHFIDDGWNLHKPVLHANVTTDHHDVVHGPILELNVDGDISDIILDHGIYERLFMVAYDGTNVFEATRRGAAPDPLHNA